MPLFLDSIGRVFFELMIPNDSILTLARRYEVRGADDDVAPHAKTNSSLPKVILLIAHLVK
jgi:hypothetical protein